MNPIANNTLVLSRRYTEDSQAMWQAAIGAGWEVLRVSLGEAPEAPPNPVLYGEPFFVTVLANSFGLAVDAPHDAWLPELPRRWLKRKVELLEARKVRNLPGPVFLKLPTDKVIPARVYASGAELDAILPDETQVLVSEPVSFGIEVRAFVLDGKVLTYSIYAREGQLENTFLEGEEGQAREFLDALLADPEVNLPRGVVIDVGRLADGWAVVEANEVASSGLYGCDPKEVLKVLRATQHAH